MTDEIDTRFERVRYRKATDQLSWFTAGHMLRKLEVEIQDIGNERRFVFKIEGEVKPGEIDPPDAERDWTDINAREAITLKEARQLGKWLLARTAPRPIRMAYATAGGSARASPYPPCCCRMISFKRVAWRINVGGWAVSHHPKKKNNHFVPRSYLRRFCSLSERQIGLYNIRSDREVEGAPIRSQCSRDYFYTKDPSHEDHFAEIEGQ
jgi:hypothetical protein